MPTAKTGRTARRICKESFSSDRDVTAGDRGKAVSFSGPPKLLLPPQPSTGIELKEELERTFDLILKQISVAVGIPERLLSPNQKGKNEREKT